MKNYCLSLLGLAALAMLATPAWAIPPFNEAFKKMYVKEGEPLAEKVEAEKCNVCHFGKKKADKNDYGKAVGKFLKKADFTGDDKKYDKPTDPEAQKAINEGLEAAGKEKSASGKTFAELLKAGELPGAAAE